MTIRAFIAIELEAGVLRALQELQERLRPSFPLARWTKAEQMHLTLRFLGNIKDISPLEAAMDRACRGFAPFTLRAQGLGCFPHARHPRVLWVGLRGELEQLGQLYGRLEQELNMLEFAPEDRPLRPHLTIARFRDLNPAQSCQVVQAIRLGESSYGDWQVDKLVLMKSDLFPRGASYTSLASVLLGSG